MSCSDFFDDGVGGDDEGHHLRGGSEVTQRMSGDYPQEVEEDDDDDFQSQSKVVESRRGIVRGYAASAGQSRYDRVSGGPQQQLSRGQRNCWFCWSLDHCSLSYVRFGMLG